MYLFFDHLPAFMAKFVESFILIPKSALSFRFLTPDSGSGSRKANERKTLVILTNKTLGKQ